MADNDALQDSEQDQDVANPGAMGQDDEADSGGVAAAPPAGMPQGAPQSPPQQAQATQPPPQAQTAAPAPQISGKTKFLGNLLKTLMAGVQNSQGNPNNAFDRGFANASPNAQQARSNQQQMATAQISKAQSEADQAKIQTSITGMKALQYEYLLKRLPQEDQEKHLDQVTKATDFLVKNGATVEATGDEKGVDAQTMHANGTDPRVTSHQGKLYSLPTGKTTDDGKPEFGMTFVPTKDALQSDFKYEDSEGNEQTIPAGTPMGGALGKIVENQLSSAQKDTKDQHKQLGDALKPNIPEGEINQTVSWLQNQQKQNTPLYQQNKDRVDGQINSLKQAQAATQSQKVEQARASAQTKQQASLAGKDTIVHTDKGDVLMSGKEAQESGADDYSTLSTKMAQDIKDKRANADASMDAMTGYQKSFEDHADKLSSSDRDALRVLTSHVQADAGNGVLGNIVEELPLVGPMTGYANKLLQGTMTSDQYKKLSPEGKELLAKYSMAVVSNFANMKQMLGSVGRNPAMIQAEMAQIPLPYIDKQAGKVGFDTKITDLNKRNASIPKVYKKGQKDSSDKASE